MDLLVTVIGNAVADPAFRTRLLEDPRAAIDEWGFRLSKGEVRILDEMFTRAKKNKLEKEFDALQDTLIEAMPRSLGCNHKMCPGFGCYPPRAHEKLRKVLDEKYRELLNQLEGEEKELRQLRKRLNKKDRAA